jgi:hypothetical protein
MKRFLHNGLLFLAISTISILSDGCRRNEQLPLLMDSLHSSTDTTTIMKQSQDTSKAKADTAHSNLPPMAKAIEPNRLATFLPKLPGWTPQGDTIKEIQVHENFNRSRVAQNFVNGSKKLKIQIDDFAYVPYLYDPWQKFKGVYLDDNNDDRTETTTIAGYRAVQSMEKKEPHGEITLFPGNRYVVSITEDGAESINEVRRIAEAMNLKGLETLQ